MSASLYASAIERAPIDGEPGLMASLGHLGIDDAGIPTLLAALNAAASGEGGASTARPLPVNLFLEQNFIGDAGVATLLAGLTALPPSLHIRRLRLHMNRVGDTGAAELARWLGVSAAAGRPLWELHLSHNRITVTGATALFTAMARYSSAGYRSNAQGYRVPLWLRLEQNQIDTWELKDTATKLKVGWCMAGKVGGGKGGASGPPGKIQCSPIGCLQNSAKGRANPVVLHVPFLFEQRPVTSTTTGINALLQGGQRVRVGGTLVPRPLPGPAPGGAPGARGGGDPRGGPRAPPGGSSGPAGKFKKGGAAGAGGGAGKWPSQQSSWEPSKGKKDKKAPFQKGGVAAPAGKGKGKRSEDARPSGRAPPAARGRYADLYGSSEEEEEDEYEEEEEGVEGGAWTSEDDAGVGAGGGEGGLDPSFRWDAEAARHALLSSGDEDQEDEEDTAAAGLVLPCGATEASGVPTSPLARGNIEEGDTSGSEGDEVIALGVAAARRKPAALAAAAAPPPAVGPTVDQLAAAFNALAMETDARPLAVPAQTVVLAGSGTAATAPATAPSLAPSAPLFMLLDTSAVIHMVAAAEDDALSFHRLLRQQQQGGKDTPDVVFILIDTVLQQLDSAKAQAGGKMSAKLGPAQGPGALSGGYSVRASVNAFMRLYPELQAAGLLVHMASEDVEDKVRGGEVQAATTPGCRQPDGKLDSDGLIIDSTLVLLRALMQGSGSSVAPSRGVVLLTSDVFMRNRAHAVGVPTALWEDVTRGLPRAAGGTKLRALNAAVLEAAMTPQTQTLVRGWRGEGAAAVAVAGDGGAGQGAAVATVAAVAAPAGRAASPTASPQDDATPSSTAALPVHLMGRSATSELKAAAAAVDKLSAALAGVMAAHGCSGGNGASRCAVCTAAREAAEAATASARDWMALYMHKQRESAAHPVLSRMGK